MQGSKDLTLATLQEKELFAEIMADPERMGLKTNQIAEKFNIAVKTIYNRLHDPEIIKLIKEKRAGRIKFEMPDIDKALIDKAKSGDVAAMSLLYQRWDDYVSRSKTEVAGYLEGSEAEAQKAEARNKAKLFIQEILNNKNTEVKAVEPEPKHE